MGGRQNQSTRADSGLTCEQKSERERERVWLSFASSLASGRIISGHWNRESGATLAARPLASQVRKWSLEMGANRVAIQCGPKSFVSVRARP